MKIQTVISTIQNSLVTTFSSIDVWFDKQPELRRYRPTTGGWTINEILEHISTTNHFLLILIDKGTTKSLQNSQNLDLITEIQQYIFDLNKFNEIGIHKSFVWVRPEHMEPTNSKTSNEVQDQLKQQVQRCFNYLDKLSNGEGLLYKTTMSVNNLGKINVYEYIYFLAQHAKRHITQMKKNEAEFQALAS